MFPPALPPGGWSDLVGAALDTVAMALLAMDARGGPHPRRGPVRHPDAPDRIRPARPGRARRERRHGYTALVARPTVGGAVRRPCPAARAPLRSPDRVGRHRSARDVPGHPPGRHRARPVHGWHPRSVRGRGLGERRHPTSGCVARPRCSACDRLPRRSSSAAASRRCLEAYDSTSSCLTTDDSTTAWSTSATRSGTPPDTCAGRRQIRMSRGAAIIVNLVLTFGESQFTVDA